MFAQNDAFPKVSLDKKKSQIVFQKSEGQLFGFDAFQQEEWADQYDTLQSSFLKEYIISYKSVGFNLSDEVNAWIRNIRNFDADSLVFKIENSDREVRFVQINDSIVRLFLPKMKMSYKITPLYRGVKLGALNVEVYPLKKQKVFIVPLMNVKLYKDSLEQQINSIYRQANIELEISYLPKFASMDFNEATFFDNPSPTNDRYTKQMRSFRDVYFERHPNADKSAYYVFIIPGFVNPKTNGYMVRNKAMAFVKIKENRKLGISIARELAHGIGMLEDSWRNNGPLIGASDNLMDQTFGTHLTHQQWDNMRHSSYSYSMYDSDEDVRTNNGIVAYYLWKEDKHGNILLEKNNLLKSISRPYKKNYMSYHLDIRDFFYKTIFTIGDYLINFWHLLVFVVLFTIAYFVRRRFHRFLSRKLKRPRMFKLFSRIVLISLTCLFYYWSFIIINRGYARFEVKSGILKDFENQSLKEVTKEIQFNKNLKHRKEKDLRSEIILKRNGNWYVKKKKRVLYFVVKQDSTDTWSICKLIKDSDSLHLEKFDLRESAESHYIVFSYLNKDGTLHNQRVYNHLGIDITSKLLLDDPAKRILVFVNGYRPTSIGHTFEDKFKDIQTRGFENPQSNNLIYNFDRYDYWRPWKEIDLKFQKRINPSETFYADGHFSVATSNHRSLVNFTSVSAMYPERCKNRNKHTCYTTTLSGSGLFGPKTIKTYELHRTKPNKHGFEKRMENGRIAGRNLLQIFNELPNKSKNDTLYIVAHSMGYAYALGIIEELRDEINFGGFYILAPENASSGSVKIKEWKEVWQYGSNFNKGKADAPCLQDGVAPQVKAKGLSDKHRTYIPSNQYKQKGFFDSHFVGYYTWIFDIKKNHTGYIRQR